MKKTVLWIIGGVILLAVGVRGGIWVHFRLTHVVSDAAYVKTEMSSMACEMSGRVLEVKVEEGMVVRKGDLLLTVNPEDISRKVGVDEAKVAKAAAGVERAARNREFVARQAEAALAAADAGVMAARAQVDKASAYRDKCAADEERFRVLVEKEAVTRAQADAVHAQDLAAQADLEAARKGLAAAEAKRKEAEAARSGVQAAEAAVEAARAEQREAESGLALSKQLESYTSVRAPIDGVVARLFVRPGDFAVQGRPLVTLYDPANLFVEVLLEEEKLAGIRVGSRAELDLDAMGGEKLAGAVTRIDPAAAAEFSLIPRDQSAGEFIRVVQRVPVRLSIEGLHDHPVLRPGLSARIAIRK